MVKAPAKDTGPGKPRIFLVLAALMAVVAGLAYYFEDELYFMRPLNPYVPSSLNTYFIGILVFSVVFALFCMYCYQVPRVGNKILGRGIPREKPPSEDTVTYNVFADTTASAVKYQHRRRKQARHERHKYTKRSKTKSKKKS